MAEVLIEVDGYQCELCGHRWMARRPRMHDPSRVARDPLPKACPACKSPHWNAPLLDEANPPR